MLTKVFRIGFDCRAQAVLVEVFRYVHTWTPTALSPTSGRILETQFELMSCPRLAHKKVEDVPPLLIEADSSFNLQGEKEPARKITNMKPFQIVVPNANNEVVALAFYEPTCSRDVYCKCAFRGWVGR